MGKRKREITEWPTGISQDIRDIGIRMVQSGATYQEVALELNVCRGTVGEWCRIAGVRVGTQFSVEERAGAVDRVRGGASYIDVARDLGTSGSIVAKWCKRVGVESPIGTLRSRPAKEIQEEAIALVAAGDSYRSATRKLHIRSGTVAEWCNRVGVKSTFVEPPLSVPQEIEHIL